MSTATRRRTRGKYGDACWRCWKRETEAHLLSMWTPLRGERFTNEDAWQSRHILHLAVLEQLMHRSADEQRCVECGKPGGVQVKTTRRSLVQSVSHYWHCVWCAAYWQVKAQTCQCSVCQPRPPAPLRRVGEVYAGYPAEIEVFA